MKIVPVAHRRDLLRFARMPQRLHPPDSPWVALLDRDHLAILDRRRHPFYREAEAELFLARDARGRDVGRIAAIANHTHARSSGDGAGFFGFFESVDNLAVARALLSAAEAWLRSRGCAAARGPVSPSTNYECGVLVAGFEHSPRLLMAYNPPYYETLLERCGYRAVRDLVARAARVLGQRNAFTLRRPDLRRLDEEIDRLEVIYNEAWQANYGFVPLRREEIRWLARSLRPILEADLCRIAEVRGEPAGVMLNFPDINPALRPLRGRLFPFGWLRLWRGLRRVDALKAHVMGVRPRFRHLGIDYAFLLEGFHAARSRGYRRVEFSWILADNVAVLRPLERLGAKETKRYRLLEKSLLASTR